MSELLVERRDAVAVLTLNRPEQRNALSHGLMGELIETLGRLRDDTAVRALVLTAAGEKAFCAGGDLTSLAGDGAFAGHLARRRYVELLEALAEVGKPVVAAVNGAALGGGFGLALACDLVVAAEGSSFGTPEVKVGLFPMMVSALLVRHVGRKRAMELVLTGQRLSAGQAFSWGLVNKVVPPAVVMDEALRLAVSLAELSPAVLRLGREAVYTAAEMEYRSSLRYLAAMLSLNVGLPDALEGVAAFLSGRLRSEGPAGPAEGR